MNGRMKRMTQLLGVRLSRSGWFGLLLGVLSLSCAAPRERINDSEGEGKPVVDMSLPREDLPSCVGLGCFVANCPVGQDTTVVGKVTAPNGVDPIREALVYVPSPRAVTIDLRRLHGPQVDARWFDPVSGRERPVAGSPLSSDGLRVFSPDGANAGGAEDWVLVLRSVR